MGKLEGDLKNSLPPKGSVDVERLPQDAVLGPIIAHVTSRESLTVADKASLKQLKGSGAEYVDWFPPKEGDTRDCSGERRSRKDEPGMYVISRVSEETKYMDWTKNCIGVAVVGFDQKIKKNISFCAHVSIDTIFAIPEGGTFLNNIKATAAEFLGRVDRSTISVALYGGVFSDRDPRFSFEKEDDGDEGELPWMTFADEYEAAIGALGIVFQEMLQVEASVAVGPSMRDWEILGADALFDTRQRRLDIIRLEQPDGVDIQPFPASEVRSHVAQWQEKGWGTDAFRKSKGFPRL